MTTQISVETIRREIERRIEQYKRMKPDGARWLDDAISIVNDVCDPYCPPAEEGDGEGMGFYPGFPPGFDPNRAAKGLPQLDCKCGHSRGRHITAIRGQILGKCHASGCDCEYFMATAATA